ncbi:conserved membrane hypothetical protein [uncultured Alphaproteobacteria bacterium]|uniref:Glycine transporter domain-containing protein n=1 Tax=uncultured Alphaproteobacteria bacterium TaxID=91750 RepID=A0A212J6W1_9PROT|nr:conserved membrane hypothetical protein [uncultured Alphaproteobacteria bacterium]
MTVLYAMDLFGTAVFAVSGGLMAARKRYDVFGFLVVAMAPAIGGGTVRDVALGALPVFWVADGNYLLATAAAALATFFFARFFVRYASALLVADAFGLALFAVVGAQKALATGAAPPIAVAMGAITAAGGGILRDVLCREEPLILRREIYATAAILGAALFVGMMEETGDRVAALVTGFLGALLLRLVAIRRNLSLPVYSENPPEDVDRRE